MFSNGVSAQLTVENTWTGSGISMVQEWCKIMAKNI